MGALRNEEDPALGEIAVWINVFVSIYCYHYFYFLIIFISTTITNIKKNWYYGFFDNYDCYNYHYYQCSCCCHDLGCRGLRSRGLSWGYEKDSDRFLSPCVLKIKGTFLGLPPYNEDDHIWGSILGCAHFRKLPHARKQ